MLNRSLRLAVALHAIQLALAIAAGAFGAHALKHTLADGLLDVWQTAVLYHLIHALGGIILGAFCNMMQERRLSYAIWGFHLGIFLFSGSLYFLSLSGIRILGVLTPLGGLCFVGIWIYVGYVIFTSKIKPH